MDDRAWVIGMKKKWSEGFMGAVLALAGVIALALFAYLTYVLFRGEEL